MIQSFAQASTTLNQFTIWAYLLKLAAVPDQHSNYSPFLVAFLELLIVENCSSSQPSMVHTMICMGLAPFRLLNLVKRINILLIFTVGSQNQVRHAESLGILLRQPRRMALCARLDWRIFLVCRKDDDLRVQ